MKTLLRYAAAIAISAVLTARATAETTLRYFPLDGPGQASIAIDDTGHRAFVVDMGSEATIEQVRVDGKPLIQALHSRGIRDLFLTCSHPHADHMGGFKVMLDDLHAFLDARGPKFRRVIFIDAYPAQERTLWSMWETGLSRLSDSEKRRLPDASRLTAWGTNAFAAMSRRGDALFVSTLPHTDDTRGGNGRAIVTETILNGAVAVLDPDDASTKAVAQVAATLEAQRRAGTLPKRWVLVLPHHGSDATDITPLLALQPSDVIISANRQNRYLHPGLENLELTLRSVGAQHVHFTDGATGGVLVRPAGVRPSADPVDNFRLYLEPRRSALLSRLATARSAQDVSQYSKQRRDLRRLDAIEALMLGGHTVFVLGPRDCPRSRRARALVKRFAPNARLTNQTSIDDATEANATLDDPDLPESNRAGMAPMIMVDGRYIEWMKIRDGHVEYDDQALITALRGYANSDRRRPGPPHVPHPTRDPGEPLNCPP